MRIRQHAHQLPAIELPDFVRPYLVAAAVVTTAAPDALPLLEAHALAALNSASGPAPPAPAAPRCASCQDDPIAGWPCSQCGRAAVVEVA